MDKTGQRKKLRKPVTVGKFFVESVYNIPLNFCQKTAKFPEISAL